LFCDKSCIKEIICDSHDRFESQIISLIHDLSQNNDKNNNGLRKSFRQGTTQKTAVQNEILWHIRTNHKLGHHVAGKNMFE
jgi:hypothetical protein